MPVPVPRHQERSTDTGSSRFRAQVPGPRRQGRSNRHRKVPATVLPTPIGDVARSDRGGTTTPWSFGTVVDPTAAAPGAFQPTPEDAGDGPSHADRGRGAFRSPRNDHSLVRWNGGGSNGRAAAADPTAARPRRIQPPRWDGRGGWTRTTDFRGISSAPLTDWATPPSGASLFLVVSARSRGARRRRWRFRHAPAQTAASRAVSSIRWRRPSVRLRCGGRAVTHAASWSGVRTAQAGVRATCGSGPTTAA